MSRGGGGLAAGLATFNSCNKAGSIPHFTRHLQSHPTDYNALMWRGRAHSIVGNMDSARADFRAAGQNSCGPRHYIAQYFEANASNDAERSVQILNRALTLHPNSHEVLGEVGTVLYMTNQYSTALPILEKSVSIIESGGNIEDPSYCWYQHSIGSIYLENKQLDAAERAFASALNFSETHTVSHIGYAQVQLAKGKDSIARRHYNRARALNPTLVTWTTFEAFKAAVQPAQPATWYETFMNLPRTLGNMALSAIGMSGSPQNSPAPVATSARQTSNSPPTRPQSTSHTRTSSRPTSAVSAIRSSANQPNYGASRSQSMDRTISSHRYNSSYRTSANQSTFSTSTDNANVRPTSSRSSNAVSNSGSDAGSSSARSSSRVRSSGSNESQAGSRQGSSRSYSSVETYRSQSRPGSAPPASKYHVSSRHRAPSHPNNTAGYHSERFYFVLGPDDMEWTRGPSAPSANQARWEESYSTTIEAARKSRSGSKHVSRTTGTERGSRTGNSARASSGRGGGSGNGGDGGGSDDDDNDSNEEWKKMRKDSREILKYGGKEYVLSKDEQHYYSRDKVGHGQSYLKIYANKKNRLDFVGSLDRNLELMEDKHESREGTSIRKSDMDVVRRR